MMSNSRITLTSTVFVSSTSSHFFVWLDDNTNTIPIKPPILQNEQHEYENTKTCVDESPGTSGLSENQNQTTLRLISGSDLEDRECQEIVLYVIGMKTKKKK